MIGSVPIQKSASYFTSRSVVRYWNNASLVAYAVCSLQPSQMSSKRTLCVAIALRTDTEGFYSFETLLWLSNHYWEQWVGGRKRPFQIMLPFFLTILNSLMTALHSHILWYDWGENFSSIIRNHLSPEWRRQFLQTGRWYMIPKFIISFKFNNCRK